MDTRSLLPFLALLAGSAALGAAAPADVERAAVLAARAADGTITPCPRTFDRFSKAKQCVTTSLAPEQLKTRLNRELARELLTAWRAQQNLVYAYNYLRSTGGYVVVIVGPYGKGSIMLLDAAPDRAPAPDPTRPDAPESASGTGQGGTQGAGTAKGGASTSEVRIVPRPQPSPNAARAGAAFRRTLALTNPRLHGEDVRAVQNRLADLAGIPRGGDGWYGPVTRATVAAFQRANDLPDTGVVNRATWDALFSTAARPFDPRDVRR